MGGIQLQESTTAATRPRSRDAALLSFICGSFVLFLICMPLLRHTITTPPGFELYRASGSALRMGDNPYAVKVTSHLTVLGKERVVEEFNLNPPCLLPIFQALSYLSWQRFSIAWTVGSFLLLLSTVGLLMWHFPEMQKRKIFWLLLAALALVFIEYDHELAAAIAIGLLVAIKPTTAFWPCFLFLGGHRKLALRSLGVTLAVSVAPLLFYGPSIYREWLAALANDPHWIYATDIATPAFFARLGLPGLGLALAGTVAALLAWTVWKTKPDFKTVSGIAMCAAILCAPLAWVGYVLLVAPYFISIRWKLQSNLAAALLIVPSAVPMMMSRPAGRLSIALGSGISFVAVWLILMSFVSPLVHDPVQAD
jgi:hypothetical protein